MFKYINLNLLYVRFLVILVLFVMSFTILLLPLKALRYANNNAENEVLAEKGERLTAYIDSRFQEVIDSIDKLKVVNLLNKGNLDNYDVISGKILAENPMIVSIAIAKEGIIKKIYPVETGAGLIGFDVLQQSNFDSDIRFARSHDKMFTTDPIELSPGVWGTKIFAPIFTDVSGFWGFYVISVKFSELFPSIPIGGILGKDGLYDVSYTNVMKNEVKMVIANPLLNQYPNKKLFTSTKVGRWTIHIASSQVKFDNSIYYIIIGILSFLLSLLGLKNYIKAMKNRVLADYDEFLGCPDRYKSILKIEEAIRNKGYLTVIVINSWEFLKYNKVRESLEALVSGSLDNRDSVLAIDKVTFVILFRSYSNEADCAGFIRLLFNKLINRYDGFKSGRAELKIGAYVSKLGRHKAYRFKVAHDVLEDVIHQDGSMVKIEYSQDYYKSPDIFVYHFEQRQYRDDRSVDDKQRRLTEEDEIEVEEGGMKRVDEDEIEYDNIKPADEYGNETDLSKPIDEYGNEIDLEVDNQKPLIDEQQIRLNSDRKA